MIQKQPKPPTGLRALDEARPAPRLSEKELAEGPIVSGEKGCESVVEGVKQAKESIRWSEFSAEKMIAFAQNIVDESHVRSKSHLLHEQPKIYWALWRRKLLDSVGYSSDGPTAPQKKRTRWERLDDDALLTAAQKLVDEGGIDCRASFNWRFSGLQKALDARGLLEKVRFRISAPPRTEWKSMGDAELVACAQKLIEANPIRNGKGMRRHSKEANSMYEALRRRGLLERVGFPEVKKAQRDWTAFSDKQLLEHARAFVKEAGITRRTGLYAADKGLCWVLHKRGLFEKVGFDSVKSRDWRSMEDPELLESAEKLINESQALSISRLAGIAHGMYNELKRRDLTKRLVFPEWPAIRSQDESGSAAMGKRYSEGSKLSRMCDAELIEYAKGYISQYGIKTRQELILSNKSLYWRLEGKRLLEDAGLPSTRPNTRDWGAIGDEEVLSLAKKLIDENDIRRVGQLFELDQGLCKQLRERGLYEKAGIGYKHRRWSRTGDDAIVSFAQSIIDGTGAANQTQLAEIDPGLDAILGRRNLTGRLTFKEDKDRYGAFSGMDDQGLLSEARKLIEGCGVKTLGGMREHSFPLFAVMRRKGLLGGLGLMDDSKEKRDWQSMSDDDVIAYAKGAIRTNSVRTRMELDRADKPLMAELRKRKLLDGLIPAGKSGPKNGWSGQQHFFALKSDSELLEMARELIAEKGMKMKKELREGNNTLYAALLKRGILDALGLENGRLPSRDWLSYKDDDLVAHATSFVEENGIPTSSTLKEKDGGLHEALRKRGLLAKINFRKRKVMTRWRKMSDAELIRHAKSFLSEKGLEGRDGLRKESVALHMVLVRRGLIDAVFKDIESSERREAVAGVLDAIESFGDGK